MSDNVKHSLIWGVVAVLTLSSVSWSIAWYSASVTTAAMQNGYSQKILTRTQSNSTGPYWVKD